MKKPTKKASGNAAFTKAFSQKAAALSDDDAPTDYLIGPAKARLTHTELFGVPYQPPVIVEGYLLQDASGDVGPGSLGKSTYQLYEAVHIILGRPLYGRRIVRPGGVLYLTAEDTREVVGGRLNEICRALELSKKEQIKVRNHFYVEDVSACPAKLVEADRYGAHRTAFVDEIIEKYKDHKLAEVVLDPTSILGPGEASGNDGMAELMRTVRMLSRGLTAAARLIHHVSQVVARSKIHDQYAGRGGTAFADNSRGNRQAVVLITREFEHEGSKYVLPADVSDYDLGNGRVLAIFVHKLSYAKRDSTPIVLVRNGFAYKHIFIERRDMSPQAKEARREAEMERIIDYVRGKALDGKKFSRNALEAADILEAVGLSRNDLREGCKRALRVHRLEEVLLPKAERRTKNTKYLVVQESGPANPANPAESRRGDNGGITCRTDPGRDVIPPGGTSIGGGIEKRQKGPPTGTTEVDAADQSRRIPPTVRRLNGRAVDHG